MDRENPIEGIDVGIYQDQIEEYQRMLEETPVKEIVRGMGETLSILAVRYIGHEDESRRDLKEAQLAIDCLTALYDKADSAFDREERLEVRNTLSFLQMAFANAVKGTEAGAAAPEEAEAPSED